MCLQKIVTLFEQLSDSAIFEDSSRIKNQLSEGIKKSIESNDIISFKRQLNKDEFYFASERTVVRE